MNDQPTPMARRHRFGLLGILALPLLAAGVLMAILGGSGPVESILVTRTAGISLPLPPLDVPDYFLLLHTVEGEIRLQTMENTTVGNGLLWELPTPVPYESLFEIELREDDLVKDDVVDRARVTGRDLAGQSFGFTLAGKPALVPVGGYALIITAVLMLLCTVGRFVRDQVV